jgi:hypothetical protein
MPKQKVVLPLLICGSLFFGSCTLDDIIGSANRAGTGMSLDEKVVLGLRTALEVGIDTSVSVASQVNGYLAHKVIKILLPADAEKALQATNEALDLVRPFTSKLEAMESLVGLTGGLDNNSFTSNLTDSKDLLVEISHLDGLSDSLVKYMNQAAEYSAPRSVPIFKHAIMTMSINDGLTLLNSPDSTAATLYLNGKTFEPLKTSYTPIVDSVLTKVPLTKYWGDFKATYNTILADYNKLLAFQTAWNNNSVVKTFADLQVNKLKPVTYGPINTESIGAWTTEKALGGLFYLVGEEEKDIRRDPFAYIQDLATDLSEILGEVFGKIMKMPK